MSRRQLAIAAAPLVVLAGLVAWWVTSPASAPAATAPAVREVRALASSAPARPVAEASSRPPAVGALVAPSAPTVAATDLAAQVDRWAGSGDPADAMRAYRAVFDCLQARRDERRPSEDVARERRNMEQAVPLEQRERVRRSWRTSAATCANLRSDQVQRRMQWLARAAEAGISMAAMDFIYEGPAGDGVLQDLDVPRPALTDAWRAQRDAYIDAALRRCDSGLVGYLGMTVQGDGKDLGAALNFWQSHARCPGDPPRAPLRDDPVAVRWLRDLGSAGLQAPVAPAG